MATLTLYRVCRDATSSFARMMDKAVWEAPCLSWWMKLVDTHIDGLALWIFLEFPGQVSCRSTLGMNNRFSIWRQKTKWKIVPVIEPAMLLDSYEESIPFVMDGNICPVSLRYDKQIQRCIASRNSNSWKIVGGRRGVFSSTVFRKTLVNNIMCELP